MFHPSEHRLVSLFFAAFLALVVPLVACELDTPPKGHGTAGTAGAKLVGGEAIARARELILTDKLTDAHDLLDELIGQDPSNPDAFMLRGIAYMRTGKIYQAVKDFNAAAQIRPTADIYYNLGNAFNQSGYFKRAARAYKVALEMTPDDPEILNNLGSALIALQRYAEARTHLQRVTQLRPNDPQAYTNLGISYHKEEAYQEGEAAYLKAIELAPEYYQAEFDLAKLYEKWGRDEDAARHYVRYLKMRPNAPDRSKIENRAWSLGGADMM